MTALPWVFGAAIVGLLAVLAWASGLLDVMYPSHLPPRSYERFSAYEKSGNWRRCDACNGDECPDGCAADETEEAL